MQVLGTDVVVGSVDAPLQLAEESLCMVAGDVASDVLLLAVVDGFMGLEVLARLWVHG